MFLITFISNPTTQDLDDLWLEKYPDVQNQPQFREVKALKNAHELEMIETYGDINYYMLRSFKTVKCLSHKNNMKQILQIQPQFIPQLYGSIYEALKNSHLVNLYHIAALVDAATTCAPTESLLNIFQFNILFLLIQYFYNELVHQFFYNLFDFEHNVFGFTPEHITSLVQYSCNMDLLSDLGQLTLHYSITERLVDK